MTVVMRILAEVYRRPIQTHHAGIHCRELPRLPGGYRLGVAGDSVNRAAVISVPRVGESARRWTTDLTLAGVARCIDPMRR